MSTTRRIAVGVAALAVFVISYLCRLVDRSFWQQVVSTFVGAALAALFAIELYYWQESRSETSRTAEARREARELLLTVKDELARNRKLLDQLNDELADQGQTVFYRTYTGILESAAVRLVELLKDHSLATNLRLVFCEYDLMNRKLDRQFECLALREVRIERL